jgi:hypothetical protein
MGAILQLLSTARGLKATDDRDRIYALLGVSDEGLYPAAPSTELRSASKQNAKIVQSAAAWILRKALFTTNMQHPALVPNYQKDLQQVYQEFVRWSVWRAPRVLNVLGHVLHGEDPSNPTSSWPSWVPRYHEPTNIFEFQVDRLRAGIVQPDPLLAATLWDTPYHPDDIDFMEVKEPEVLQLDGFLIDTVQQTSNVLDGAVDASIDEAWTTLFSTPLFPRPTGDYLFVPSRIDVAFFQSLVAGGVPNLFCSIDGATGSIPDTSLELVRQAHYVANVDTLAWLRQTRNCDPNDYPDLKPPSDAKTSKGDLKRQEMMRFETCTNRRIYKTSTGMIGVGPRFLQPGDFVVALFGGKLPFILRPHGNDWWLIGETYLHNDDVLLGVEATNAKLHAQDRVKLYRLV